MPGKPIVPPDVALVIQAYTHAIRPAFTFILISSVFGAMLLPLLIMLLGSSSSHSRRQPIFILNILSLILGIIVAVLSTHLSIYTVLFPLEEFLATEDFVQVILYMWMPWITGAILILRVIIIFAPLYVSRWQLAPLFVFPFAMKVARAVLIIVFVIQWRKKTSQGVHNQFTATAQLGTWVVKASWILEMLDNGYISLLFLWRLGSQGHLFNRVQQGTLLKEQRSSFSDRLLSLFWITSTNFIFPLVFNLCQVIILFVSNNLLLAASIENVNIYVSIISCVFASIWASTSSYQEAIASHSNLDKGNKTNKSFNLGLHFQVTQSGEEHGSTHVALDSPGEATLKASSCKGEL